MGNNTNMLHRKYRNFRCFIIVSVYWNITMLHITASLESVIHDGESQESAT